MIERMKRSIIHPFLLALFPVLSLFVRNAEQLAFREAIGTVIAVSIFAVSLWLLVGYVVKNRNKSAIIVSASLVSFFSYGHVLLVLAAVLYRTQILREASLLLLASKSVSLAYLVAWCVLLGAVFYLTMKTASDLCLITQFLNILSVSVIVAVAANWCYVRARADEVSVYIDSWQKNAHLEKPTNSVTPGSLPDIYYIILDGYARADILKEMYQVDNSELLSYLTEKGFYVANESRANYCQTGLSLASSLNLTYLDGLVSQIGNGSSNRLPLAVMIENNRVVRHLRDYGYTMAVFSTGYSITEIASADVRMSPCWSLNAFQNKLINATPLPVFLELPFLKTQRDFHRERILYTLDHLADATEIDGPTFVFAHIVAPHPPFVFGAHGEHVQLDREYAFGMFTLADGSHFTAIAGKDEYVRSYRNQLAFISARLQIAIEEILSRSPEPPIIIIQADHGPGSMLDWQSAQDSSLPERMSILNAYHFPDQDYGALYQGITPVNTFRVLLNGYFGTGYEILEDKSYFSLIDRPYSFIDVTDKVTK